MQFAHISLFTAGSSVGDYRIQPSKAMVSEVNLKQRLRQLDLPVPPLPRPAPTVRPACAAGLADLASAMGHGWRPGELTCPGLHPTIHRPRTPAPAPLKTKIKSPFLVRSDDVFWGVDRHKHPGSRSIPIEPSHV